MARDYVVKRAGERVRDLYIDGRVLIPKGLWAVIERCVITGAPAAGRYSRETHCVTSPDGLDLGGTVIDECVIGGAVGAAPWLNGVLGGDVRVRRSTIFGVVDGVSCTAVVGRVVVEGCMIVAGAQGSWTPGAAGFPRHADGRTHGDGVQIHQGKGIVVRDCVISGFSSAGVMVKQEVSDEVARRIDDVDVLGNTIMGGASGVNLVLARGNTLGGVRVVGNTFAPHDDPGHPYLIHGKGCNAVVAGNEMADGQPVVVKRW